MTARKSWWARDNGAGLKRLVADELWSSGCILIDPKRQSPNGEGWVLAADRHKFDPPHSPYKIDIERLSPKALPLVAQLLFTTGESILRPPQGRWCWAYLVGVPAGGGALARILADYAQRRQCASLELAVLKKGRDGFRLTDEAALPLGMRAVVVEDVVRSGQSTLNAATLLRSEDMKVGAALCLIDREEGGRLFLSRRQIRLRRVFTATQLFAYYVATHRMTQKQWQVIKAYQRRR